MLAERMVDRCTIVLSCCLKFLLDAFDRDPGKVRLELVKVWEVRQDGLRDIDRTAAVTMNTD